MVTDIYIPSNTHQFPVQKPVGSPPTGSVTPQAPGNTQHRWYPHRKSEEDEELEVWNVVVFIKTDDKIFS